MGNNSGNVGGSNSGEYQDIGYERYPGGEAALNDHLDKLAAEEEAFDEQYEKMSSYIEERTSYWDEGGSGDAIAYAASVVQDMLDEMDFTEIMELTPQDLDIEIRSAIREYGD